MMIEAGLKDESEYAITRIKDSLFSDLIVLPLLMLPFPRTPSTRGSVQSCWIERMLCGCMSACLAVYSNRMCALVLGVAW